MLSRFALLCVFFLCSVVSTRIHVREKSKVHVRYSPPIIPFPSGNKSSNPNDSVEVAPSKPLPNPESDCLPANCLEIKLSPGNHECGIYTIYPRKWFNEKPFQVYCDMETDGGGWTVIQRRGSFSGAEVEVDFDRDFHSYREGFGNLKHEFWLGLDKIFLLTVQDQNSLRVDMEDFHGNTAHGIYMDFLIGDRDKKYAIYTSDFFGPAGDPLWQGTPFSTKDENSIRKQCNSHFSGGWWLNDNCPAGQHMNNLNGKYYFSEGNEDDGIYWITWKPQEKLSWTEMKIRPSFFPKCTNGGSHYYYS